MSQETDSEVLTIDQLQAIIRFEGDTPEEKLCNAKIIVEQLEREAFKLRAELKRSEAVIKKLQDATSIQGQNMNNTSSRFMLPSEFKKKWEVLVQETILDVYSEFIEDHFYLVKLVQDFLAMIYHLVEQQLQNRIHQFAEILKVEENELLFKYMLKLLQDQYKEVFVLPTKEELQQLYKEKVGFYITEQIQEQFQEVLDSPDYFNMCQNVFQLSLHMILQDQQITINFTEFLDYKIFEKPDEYYCIDGFPRDRPYCVTVVPTVLKHNFAYQGIKPGVLILNKDIQLISEEQQKELLNPPQPPLQKSQNETKEDILFHKVPQLRKSSPAKELSSHQIIELYSRHKQKIKQFQATRNLEEEYDRNSFMPLQKKSPQPLQKNQNIENTDQITRTLNNRSRDISRSCKQCCNKQKCQRCSQAGLMVIANKLNRSNLNPRYNSSSRNNKIFSSPSNPDRKREFNHLLTKKLAEAATRMDRKRFMNNKINERDNCKVV